MEREDKIAIFAMLHPYPQHALLLQHALPRLLNQMSQAHAMFMENAMTPRMTAR